MKRSSSRRAAYNLTLPVELMKQFDATLGKKQARSGVIEQLIREHLAIASVHHHYRCQCGHEITTPNKRQRFCRAPKCVGFEMKYLGLWDNSETPEY